MGKTQKKTTAFAYLRTSSAANIGEDKDSGQRQQVAIETHAARAGIAIVGSYYDEVVKGSDPIETRPGFAALLEALEANGAKSIIVETANRFARDLMVQEVGFAMLQKRDPLRERVHLSKPQFALYGLASVLLTSLRRVSRFASGNAVCVSSAASAWRKLSR